MTAPILFYRFPVTGQVFYKSKYTYALVNLKPLVPGHVMIVPLRTSVLRLADLSPEESSDYMASLQLVHRFIIHYYKADSLNIAIQDGPESGQSVPHLHTHLIPRYKSDGWGDGIYHALEKNDLDAAYRDFALRREEFTRKPANELAQEDWSREPRSIDVMTSEADALRQALATFENRGSVQH